jgi:uncharacterized membrane protein
MSGLCMNCCALLGPVLVSMALIIWGISSKLVNWSDLKDRNIILIAIGIVLLALSFVWMFTQVLQSEEDINYLHLFAPSLMGLAVTSLGVFLMRKDVNFTRLEYAYTGLALFLGSLLWLFWVLQAFS